MTKVFIDGSAGTTGLRIRERLASRKDLELIVLPEETRKDPAARADALNSADVSFLCLPDAAAVEAVENGLVRIFKGNEELCELDEEIDIAEGDVFTFVKLTMLAGSFF